MEIAVKQVLGGYVSTPLPTAADQVGSIHPARSNVFGGGADPGPRFVRALRDLGELAPVAVRQPVRQSDHD